MLDIVCDRLCLHIESITVYSKFLLGSFRGFVKPRLGHLVLKFIETVAECFARRLEISERLYQTRMRFFTEFEVIVLIIFLVVIFMTSLIFIIAALSDFENSSAAASVSGICGSIALASVTAFAQSSPSPCIS